MPSPYGPTEDDFAARPERRQAGFDEAFSQATKWAGDALGVTTAVTMPSLPSINMAIAQVQSKPLRQQYEEERTAIMGPKTGSPYAPGASDFNNSVQTRVNARGEQGFYTGFISSSLSSLPEFFGMPAPVESVVFRERNPWTGFASEMLGPGGAYAAAFRVSKLGKFATKLDDYTEFVTRRSKAVQAGTTGGKFFQGAVRETLRYTPLELSRLGVGFTVWPENKYNLMGDVALGFGFNFALGGAGGALRAAGTKLSSWRSRRQRGLLEKENGLLPTFELRNMKAMGPEAFEEGADIQGLIAERTRQVLGARPGTRTRGQPESIKQEKPFWSLGIGEQGEGIFNKMFKPNSTSATAKDLEKAGLDVRMFGGASKAALIPKKMQKQIFKMFGAADESDFAANFVYPRVATVTNPRMAGEMATALAPKGESLYWYKSAQAFVAKDGDGLWTVAKRLGNEGNPKNKAFGPAEIRKGDTWLVTKTDRLDLILPGQHKIASRTMADWAKQAAPYRIGTADDWANAQMDTILQSISHLDWEAMRGGTKAAGMAKIAANLQRGIGRQAGLTDNKALKDMAAGIWDAMVPTARKDISNPVYQRLWGMLKGVSDRADEISGMLSRGKAQIVGSPLRGKVEYKSYWADLDTEENLLAALSPDEISALGNATQVAGSEMANVLEELLDGPVSGALKKAVEQLQEINRRTLDEFVIPAFKNAGVEEKVEWLESYIMPRVFRGDNYLDIKDAKGKLIYKVNAHTAAETQRVAKAIVDEAALDGKTWTMGEVGNFTKELDEAFDIERVMEAVTPLGAGDAGVQDVVMRGLRNATRAKPGIAKVRSPGSIANKRGDFAMAATQWTKEDLLNAIVGHRKRLLRYGGYMNWQKRWTADMLQLEDMGGEMFAADLKRKASQLAGVQGPHARAQDDLLRDALGLPGKPMTTLANIANSYLYHSMLGILNFNFALLNIVSPLITAMPWVAMMTSAKRSTMLQHMQTLPAFDAAGNVSGWRHALEPIKIMGKSWKILSNPDAEQRRLMEKAVNDGVFEAQVYENFVGGAGSAFGGSIRETFKRGGVWEGTKHLVTAPATRSEQFARLNGFTVGLALGRDFFGLADDALYRFAKRANEQVSYGYGQVDRARILTGPLGSTIGLFKNWQFHYINQMFEYAGLAKDKLLGREGTFAPLLWMLGTSGAVAGVGGTVLRGPIDGMVNMLTEQKTMFEWMQNNWAMTQTVPWSDEITVGDGLYFGLPAMVGASLQASSSMPGSDLVQDMTNLTNVVAWERGKQIGGVALEMMEYSKVTGNNGLNNENLRARFIGATMPRAVARLYATTEENAIMSIRSGYPSVQDVSPTAKLLYGLGINQTEVERQQIAGRQLWKEQERQRMLMKNLGMSFVQAKRDGDKEEMRRVLDLTMAYGMSLDSVLRSASSRESEFEGDGLDRYDKVRVEEYFQGRGK